MRNMLSEPTSVVEPALFSILIRAESVHCGMPLSQLSLPERCAVLGILREQQLISFEADPAICVGDRILAIALHPMMAPALKVFLKRTHPVYYSLDDCLIDSRPAIPSFRYFCSDKALVSV